MKKKLLIILALFVSVCATSQNINTLRSQYPEAVKSNEITDKLERELANVNSENSAILLAYKGAILTLMAKFSKSKNDKKKFFKEGVSLLETAVKADSNSIEIRYLRLSVQENSPRFLGYHKDIEVDKAFILKNHYSVTSNKLKSVIKEFILNSKNFDDTEKSVLK